MSDNRNTLQHSAPVDPKAQGPKPEYSQDGIPAPGLDSEMSPAADHGEESYRGLGRLTDRVALITGGDSGIGRAVAIAYAREGADVLISYLPEEEEDARDTAQLVEKAGRKAVTVPGDIRDEAHCRAIIDRALSDLGGLDILVNNAAYQMAQPGRRAAPARRRVDHQHRLRPGVPVVRAAAGLRDHQGRHRGVHQGAGRG